MFQRKIWNKWWQNGYNWIRKKDFIRLLYRHLIIFLKIRQLWYLCNNRHKQKNNYKISSLSLDLNCCIFGIEDKFNQLFRMKIKKKVKLQLLYFVNGFTNLVIYLLFLLSLFAWPWTMSLILEKMEMDCHICED